MYELIISFGLLFIIYASFYLLTKKTKYIRVYKKFKLNNDILKIHDDQNIEYLLCENLFISQKKCNEMWDKIKEDELNYMTYYGVNYPMIGFKYCIVNVC
jgi:hypothetical protein